MSALITRPSSRNSSQNKKPTPYEINVRIEDTGIFNVGVTEDSARKVTEVLQDNLERHHIIYNMMGFHSE
jgi:anti-sigma regulatory factor (Ser/Thr protein kinase)